MMMHVQALKYEIHAVASALSLHNPVVKFNDMYDISNLTPLTPEEQLEFNAKLIVSGPMLRACLCSDMGGFKSCDLCRRLDVLDSTWAWDT